MDFQWLAAVRSSLLMRGTRGMACPDSRSRIAGLCLEHHRTEQVPHLRGVGDGEAALVDLFDRGRKLDSTASDPFTAVSLEFAGGETRGGVKLEQ